MPALDPAQGAAGSHPQHWHDGRAPRSSAFQAAAAGIRACDHAAQTAAGLSPLHPLACQDFPLKPPPENLRYNRLSVGLHWGMLLLLVAVYACMELSGGFPKGSDTRAELKTWHYLLGTAVLLLVWLRLLVKLGARTPPVRPEPPPWQRRLSSTVQVALYVLMIAMPLAGWLILNAKGQAVPFFGIELPVLIAENRDTAGRLKEIHEAGATLGYLLLGIHAAAALFHHVVLRDNTLQRMLWSRR
jgi:cytochrome b561